MQPHLSALQQTEPACYWLDRPERPTPNDPLSGDVKADLAIVGGGFTGLWAALQSIEESPGRRVVLVEATTIGDGASGRNGGFANPSITHGLANAYHHFPEEVQQLEEIGAATFRGLVDDAKRHGIDANVEETGTLGVARAEHEVDPLRLYEQVLHGLGQKAAVLDRDAVQQELRSPALLAGIWYQHGGILDPARLAWGLLRTIQRLGVEVWENSPVTGLAATTSGIELACARGRIRADKVVLGTNAFPSPLRSVRRATIPIWDYVLVTEPLSPSQMASIGWANRQGVVDLSNLFHYYRPTADDRILWGGFDAVYHFGSRLEKRFEQRPESFEGLARRFFETFPQLEGLRFTHSWGGPIASTTRFCMDVGSAHDGRVAWAIGYTGNGVVASRFGARAALDLLDHPEAPHLSLEIVRKRGFPWPPEPVRSLAVSATRAALARADRTGTRGWWLQLLDRLKLGFAS